jgi:hypothetical protein
MDNPDLEVFWSHTLRDLREGVGTLLQDHWTVRIADRARVTVTDLASHRDRWLDVEVSCLKSLVQHDLGTQKYMRTLSEERWLKAWVGDSTLDRWEERYACGLYLKEGTPFDVATRLVLLLMGAEEER